MKAIALVLGLSTLALFPACRSEPPALSAMLDQIEYLERKTRIHTFTLIHGNPPEFVLTLSAPGGEPRTHVLEMGESFSGERFQVTGHCLKKVQGEAGITTTITELEITDSRSGKVHAVHSNAQLKLPDYYAKFQFSSEPDSGPLFVREGESFTLPGDDEHHLVLMEASDDQAVIGMGGKKIGEVSLAKASE